MNKSVVIVVIVLVVVAGVWFYFQKAKFPSYDLVSFAQCLARKPVTMYGAAWCSHCQNQKKLFGSAFQYVPYVECTVETQKCLDQKIDGYPTWVFSDGTRLPGEQTLKQLAKASVCPLLLKNK